MIEDDIRSALEFLRDNGYNIEEPQPKTFGVIVIWANWNCSKIHMINYDTMEQAKNRKASDGYNAIFTKRLAIIPWEANNGDDNYYLNEPD